MLKAVTAPKGKAEKKTERKLSLTLSVPLDIMYTLAARAEELGASPNAHAVEILRRHFNGK